MLSRKISFRLFCLVILFGVNSLIILLYFNISNIHLRPISLSLSDSSVASPSMSETSSQKRYQNTTAGETGKNDLENHKTGRGLESRGKVMTAVENNDLALNHLRADRGSEKVVTDAEDVGNLEQFKTDKGLEGRDKMVSDTQNVKQDLEYIKSDRGSEARNKVVTAVEIGNIDLKHEQTDRGLEKVVSVSENVKNGLKHLKTNRGLEKMATDNENVENDLERFKTDSGLESRGKVMTAVEKVNMNLKYKKTDRGPKSRGTAVFDTEKVKDGLKHMKYNRGVEKVVTYTEKMTNHLKQLKTDSGLEPRDKMVSATQNVKNDMKYLLTGRGLEAQGKVVTNAKNMKNDLKHIKTNRGLEKVGSVTDNVNNDLKHLQTDRGLESRGNMLVTAVDKLNTDLNRKKIDRGLESRDKAVSGTESVTNGPNPLDTHRGPEPWGSVVRPRANITALWKQENNSSTLCPKIPAGLVGHLKTSLKAPSWTEIARLNPGLEPGGHYQPAECKARHRVAIIIPYRNREEHLRVLLHNLHPMLKRQQLDYFILVVEQTLPTTFNRGMLLNIGAVEALGLWDVQCVIFHDVDLLPEDDRNLYSCPEMPRHMSVAIDKFDYRLPYTKLFGGVTAMSVKDFYKLNGCSNLYFGWGGEDDDISKRLFHMGLTVRRYNTHIARYRMIRHGKDQQNENNPMRFNLLRDFKQRMPWDGLNSLQYEVKKVDFTPAYTWMLVSIDEKKMLQGLR